MNIAALDGFPDTSRVWVFGAERELTRAEARALFDAVDAFLEGWAAHGVPLRAAGPGAMSDSSWSPSTSIPRLRPDVPSMRSSRS